ncbi:MAG: recombinase family protein [Anaerofustis sp.]
MNITDQYDIRYVAIYIRKSRAESMEDLEKHRMILTELCHKNHLKYVEYLEVGTSDSIDMRPKISKLLKEVEDCVYDAVCVVEYDRLGRGDLGEQDRLKKAFQKSNTLIITPDKIYDLNDDIDDTYADLKGFFARQEYKMITKRLKQGKKIGARRGQWTNGTPPFPYVYERYHDQYNEKGLVVNSERLEIYRDIITLALRGDSPRKIAENLNLRGIKTPKENYWSHITIQRLLIDETHLGKIISNKSQGDAHQTKRPNAKEYKPVPKSEWIIVENCHEAVKSQTEHEEILRFIHERSIKPVAARKQKHALTGLLKCSLCGHYLSFNLSRKTVLIKHCWYVDEFGNKCTNRGLSADLLEELILEKIKEYTDSSLALVDPEDHEKAVYIKKLLEEKNKQLTKYESALEKVNEVYELGDYSRREWIKRREKWLNLIEHSTYEMKQLKVQYKQIRNISPQERKDNLKTFLDTIRSVSENAQRNDLYRTIINSIDYLRVEDDVSIRINFK